MKIKVLVSFLCIVLVAGNAYCTDPGLTQTIKGKVVDKETQQPLAGATIIVSEMIPTSGTTTNEEGYFILHYVPIGRVTIKISYVGYQTQIVSELLVNSGKEIVITVELIEQVINFDQIEVKAYKRKDRPLNSMTSVSARVFSIEETSRYAGGFDDPARLASAFAGVASNDVGSNGIAVRGNSPTGVQWRIESVEVNNPNHFAGAKLLGGGFVSFFSNQLLSNSDFLTGAFPSEYGNVLSAVFDLKLRTGNTDKREYTFQAGSMGFEFAAEGPFSKEKQSSYLINYRYSTYGLLQNFLPAGEGLPIYQDLCFKFHFQTKAGVFSFWGAGALDDYYTKAETDSTEWDMISKRMDKLAEFNTAIAGLSHKYILKNDAYINSSLVYAYNTRINTVKWIGNDLNLYDQTKYNNVEQQFVFSSFINKKFSPEHTNRTGIVVKSLYYDYSIQTALQRTEPMDTLVKDNGATYLLQFYSQSKINLGRTLVANMGLHYQYLFLNGSMSIEPRIGLQWNMTKRSGFAIAYGNHAQMQELGYYIYEDTDNGLSNHDLDFTRAHHFILSYDYQITENMRLKIEPYYQYLYNIPVIKDSSYSIINLERMSEISSCFVNEGTGTNIGIDFTLERFLYQGYYYMITASLFDSKYIGGDHVERDTRFNKNYIVNILGGKEWNIGKNSKNNVLGLNGRLYYYGGNRQSPVLEEASLKESQIVYDDSHLFENQEPSTLRFDLSATYRWNRPRFSSIIELQLMNALGTVITYNQDVDFVQNKVVEQKGRTIMPSISWKIEF